MKTTQFATIKKWKKTRSMSVLKANNNNIRRLVNKREQLKQFESVPAVGDRNNSCSKLGEFEEDGHSEVKMFARRVAPTTIIVRLSIVRWAKVRCCNKNRRVARIAPLRVINTLEFKASTTC